jgi:DNA-binding NarL/FixJ family response regulator
MPIECARILMLDDDGLQARAVQRTLKGVAKITAVGSCGAADEAMARGPWSGLLVDVLLPDGSGLEWLTTVRRNGCEAPALVLTNLLDRELINAAFDVRATYVCKPLAPKGLRDFVGSLTMHDRASGQFGLLAESALRVLGARGLTGSELEIVAAAVAGVSSRAFIEARGISMNTYKTQVRSVLRKTGAESVGELRDRVLRDAGSSKLRPATPR